MTVSFPDEARLEARAITHRRRVRYGPEMRVLIVGGGIAGLTLAALLEQRGFSPLVIEKTPNWRSADFAIGLWPAGNRILKGLSLFPQFCSIGVECTRYRVASEAGETLHSFSFDAVTKRYGPLVDISYGALIQLLRSAISTGRTRTGVTVKEIVEEAEGVRVAFDDGRTEVFDVVVGCDGARSSVRALVFGEDTFEYAGITGLAFWLAPPVVPPPEVVEYWAAEWFVRMYPTRDRVCVFAAAQAAPNASASAEDRKARLTTQFDRFRGMMPEAFAEMNRAQIVYHDDFTNVATDEWTRGRVVLIGDAAHAMVPTSGMGASLAMESAAVLTEELCRTDSRLLCYALERYVSRRRPRIERIQAQSRRLRRVMFAGSALLKSLRDRAMRVMADEPVLDFVDDLLAERI